MKQQRHNKESKIRSQGSEVIKRLSTDSGFTLVELMIAIVIGMILIGSIYGTFISQQSSFTTQDQVAEMNTASKVALDMIVNDIREIGFCVPEAGTYTINGFANVIIATDSTTTPDSITVIGGSRRAGTLCSNAAGNAISSTDTQLILVPLSGYTQLDNINTTDKKNISIAGISFGIVTAGGGATTTITLQNSIGKKFPKYTDSNGNEVCDDGEGMPVYLVEDITYQVVGTQLKRGTNVIAENIEDFQIAYGVDTDSDGIVNDFRYSPPNNKPLVLLTDKVLSIRVNILATTARQDPSFQGQGKPPNPIENRNNHVATNDSLRRRWWRMEVGVRNPI